MKNTETKTLQRVKDTGERNHTQVVNQIDSNTNYSQEHFSTGHLNPTPREE